MAVGVADYSKFLKSDKLCLIFVVANARSRTGFFHKKRVENSAPIKIQSQK